MLTAFFDHRCRPGACLHFTDVRLVEQQQTDAGLSDAPAHRQRQYAHTVPAVEGAVEYVRSCRRQGKRMCVVTANDTPLTEMVLQRLGILEDMEFILSSEESGLTKRTPQMVLEAARRLQLDPSECVMLEDSLYSMKSAKQAGCYVIAVASADQADYAQICATADEVHEDLRTASIR